MTRIALLLIGLTSTLTPAAEPPAVPKDTLPANLELNEIPLGLGKREIPSDNPLTAERVALGRKLFFDPILSANNTVACATCHQPELGFAGVGAKSVGIHGRTGTRRAPTLFNRAFGTTQFWDGRTKSLEEQALEPISNPSEMGSSVDDALKKLQADAAYLKLFATAFGDGVTAKNLGKALAGFQRTLLRGDSGVDRFRLKGDRTALTEKELFGFWIYESKGACWKCHGGQNFTDDGFRNTGVSWGSADLGRFTLTNKIEDKGKFKTPTLRGVKLRAPYMHDGSLATLEEVVEFYNRGGGKNPHLDPMMKPLDLKKEEQDALVAFLKSL